MKREIKFRAWLGNLENRMEYNPRIPFPSYGLDFAVNEVFDLTQFGSKIIWMQYTGLKDKNGKEIYEGDIYNYEGEIDVFESIEDFYYSELIRYRVEEGEIIGNIYENPDLIT